MERNLINSVLCKICYFPKKDIYNYTFNNGRQQIKEFDKKCKCDKELCINNELPQCPIKPTLVLG
jgi:hypothetical protein